MESSQHHGTHSDNCTDESKKKSGLIQMPESKKRKVTEESKPLPANKWISYDNITRHILTFMAVSNHRAAFTATCFRVWNESRKASSFPPVIELFPAEKFTFLLRLDVNSHLYYWDLPWQRSTRFLKSMVENPLTLVSSRTAEVAFVYTKPPNHWRGRTVEKGLFGDITCFGNVVACFDVPRVTIRAQFKGDQQPMPVYIIPGALNPERLDLYGPLELPFFGPPSRTRTLLLDECPLQSYDGLRLTEDVRHLVFNLDPASVNLAGPLKVWNTPDIDTKHVKELTIRNHGTDRPSQHISTRSEFVAILLAERRFFDAVITDGKEELKIKSCRFEHSVPTTFLLCGLLMAGVDVSVCEETKVIPITQDDIKRYGMMLRGAFINKPDSFLGRKRLIHAGKWLSQIKKKTGKPTSLPYAGQERALESLFGPAVL